MELIIFFLIFTFILLLSGFPVAFILSGVSLLFAIVGVYSGFFDYSYLMAFPNRLFGIMNNQNLLAVPLFIFMGLVLEKTKIAENLISNMNMLFKKTFRFNQKIIRKCDYCQNQRQPSRACDSRGPTISKCFDFFDCLNTQMF